MTPKEYSVRLETEFNAFDIDYDFDSDTINIKPYKAITSGLDALQTHMVIGKEICEEYKQLYKSWNNKNLQEVLEDSVNEEQLKALLNCLKDWYNQYNKQSLD